MPRGISMLGAVCFVTAAVLLYASLPLAWGGGDAPDGTRYKLSPVWLSHVLKPHQTVSPTERCRIHGAASPERCRIGTGGEEALSRFQLVRTLVFGGAALCLLASLLGFFPGSPAPVRLTTGLAATLVPVAAMVLFSAAARSALEALTNADFGLAATLGTMMLILATALALGGTGLLLRPRLTAGRKFVALAALLVLPFAGLRFGGWPGVAGAFGLGLLVFITLSASGDSLPKTD